LKLFKHQSPKGSLMKIAILADPLELFKTHKDTTFAMMREAAARGHALYVFEQDQMLCEAGVVGAHAARVHMTEEHGKWYRKEAPVTTPLAHFDAVLVRKDPPFNMEYIYSTYLLEIAERQGARVFNRPGAIRNQNEKLSIIEFAQFTAPTLVARDGASLRAFHALHGDVIFKPLDGMGGAGIFRVREDGMNLGAIIETLTADGAVTIMAQRYIGAIAEGDKRILLIGGKVVPHALARIPQHGEVRGNLAAGGRGEARLLSVRDREIADTLAPQLYARGLLLVGLDVIGEHLTEVNVTSPTCFREIMQQTGFDVAGMFIDALETAAGAPSTKEKS
jgi:glutathione synthase